MRTVAIVSAAFAAIFAYSEACTCWSQHPQTHFCNSDFVIRAAILNRKSVNMEIVYTVRILKEFKNGAGRGYSQKQDIYTNPSSASCGSYFELRKEYIISGSINRGKWVTYLCEFNAVPSSLTQYQRAALDLGIYENSCSCKIERCGFQGKKCPEQTRDSCDIISDSDATCRYQNNSCRLTPYGCYWDSSACSNNGNNGYQNL